MICYFFDLAIICFHFMLSIPFSMVFYHNCDPCWTDENAGAMEEVSLPSS